MIILCLQWWRWLVKWVMGSGEWFSILLIRKMKERFFSLWAHIWSLLSFIDRNVKWKLFERSHICFESKWPFIIDANNCLLIVNHAHAHQHSTPHSEIVLLWCCINGNDMQIIFLVLTNDWVLIEWPTRADKASSNSRHSSFHPNVFYQSNRTIIDLSIYPYIF